MRFSENMASIFAWGEDDSPIAIQTILGRISLKSIAVITAITLFGLECVVMQEHFLKEWIRGKDAVAPEALSQALRLMHG